MGTLPFVDRQRLFGLGVCASGGYIVLVATTDKRQGHRFRLRMLGNRESYFGADHHRSSSSSGEEGRYDYYEGGRTKTGGKGMESDADADWEGKLWV